MKIPRPRLIALLVAGLLAASASAADSPAPASIEERLQRLENEVSALRAQNQQLQNRLEQQAAASAAPASASVAASSSAPKSASPTAPAPTTVATPVLVKASGKEQSLSLGGFLQAQADFLDKGDSRFGSSSDRFYLRRARIALTGRYSKGLDFKLDVEMAGSLYDSTGYRGQLMDGYVNWTPAPAFGLRIGQFKTPYGFEQLSSDTALPVIERSLGNDRLTLGRQIGFQIAGDSLDKRLSYAAGLFNGTGSNTNINDYNTSTHVKDGFLSVARASAVLLKTKIGAHDFSWTLGTNAFSSKDTGVTGLNDFGLPANTFTGQRTGVGFDTQLHFGAFDLWSEYLLSRFKPTDNIPADVFEARGWNAQLSYNVVPKYWQAVTRFETFDPNTARSGNSTDLWIIGGNYLFGGDSFKLMLDYLLVDAASQPDLNQKIIIRFQTIF